MGRGRAVVVLDSRGDLIRTVANLKVFEPGERMHDPVSLNLFDARIERLSGYAAHALALDGQILHSRACLKRIGQSSARFPSAMAPVIPASSPSVGATI